ncbi:hypothetical protein [Novosphingobium album (ex Hu et al. 2023)]|uniref:DUF423 domain-containing protein n=1 Tax=Novosphingobium album (ex Hu et al. 2023) TaxID=2930093 RepID=A0ABT0AYT3_9SPHN|nr:hypothetical protein [Novosphingobium album (ex Hu et al. 2023)]MCJ2177957.1 hypothetical protein [Novosphingobium album (ex Hu et al. 2023)]
MKGLELNSIASVGLVLGGATGIAGTFAPSAALRGLLWGIDGTSLTIAAVLLTLSFLRAGHDLVAGGFLVFAFGQCLVLATAAMPLDAGAPILGAGAALWAAGLVLVSFPRTLPLFVRLLGLAAALLLGIPAVRILLGEPVNALTQPLPFNAYPVLVATMLGWVWTLWKRPPATD